MLRKALAIFYLFVDSFGPSFASITACVSYNYILVIINGFILSSVVGAHSTSICNSLSKVAIACKRIHFSDPTCSIASYIHSTTGHEFLKNRDFSFSIRIYTTHKWYKSNSDSLLHFQSPNRSTKAHWRWGYWPHGFHGTPAFPEIIMKVASPNRLNQQMTSCIKAVLVLHINDSSQRHCCSNWWGRCARHGSKLERIKTTMVIGTTTSTTLPHFFVILHNFVFIHTVQVWPYVQRHDCIETISLWISSSSLSSNYNTLPSVQHLETLAKNACSSCSIPRCQDFPQLTSAMYFLNTVFIFLR